MIWYFSLSRYYRICHLDLLQWTYTNKLSYYFSQLLDELQIPTLATEESRIIAEPEAMLDKSELEPVAVHFLGGTKATCSPDSSICQTTLSSYCKDPTVRPIPPTVKHYRSKGKLKYKKTCIHNTLFTCPNLTQIYLPIFHTALMSRKNPEYKCLPGIVKIQI